MPLIGGQDLVAACEKLGKPPAFFLGHHWNYYEARGITLDVRWPEFLSISPESDWGYQVMALVGFHNLDPNHRGEVLQANLIVEKNTHIYSRALLFNCVIGEGAIVGAGAVVCSTSVDPHTMVVGNPARVIKRWHEASRGWRSV